MSYAKLPRKNVRDGVQKRKDEKEVPRLQRLSPEKRKGGKTSVLPSDLGGTLSLSLWTWEGERKGRHRCSAEQQDKKHATAFRAGESATEERAPPPRTSR